MCTSQPNMNFYVFHLTFVQLHYMSWCNFHHHQVYYYKSHRLSVNLLQCHIASLNIAVLVVLPKQLCKYSIDTNLMTHYVHLCMYNNIRLLTIYITKNVFHTSPDGRFLHRPWSIKDPSKTCRFFNK
jgi:hypothetical protein